MTKIKELYNILIGKVENNDVSIEQELRNIIDEGLKKKQITWMNTSDDAIDFFFKIYFYKRKYKPFVSYSELFARSILFLILFILILIPFISGIIGPVYNQEFDYKALWIITCNVAYAYILIIYLPLRLYKYIRLLLNKEIIQSSWVLICKWIVKSLLVISFVPFTWFVGMFIASMIQVFWMSVSFTILDLQ